MKILFLMIRGHAQENPILNFTSSLAFSFLDGLVYFNK